MAPSPITRYPVSQLEDLPEDRAVVALCRARYQGAFVPLPFAVACTSAFTATPAEKSRSALKSIDGSPFTTDCYVIS